MDYESKTLAELREIAKGKGIEKVSSMRKADLIKALQGGEKKAAPKKPAGQAKPEASRQTRPAGQAKKPAETRQTRPAGQAKPAESGQQRTSGQKGLLSEEVRDMKRHDAYHGNMRSRYHDGTDGLVSVMKERQIVDVPPTELKDLDSGITKNGILEIMAEGFGFIRCDNYLPGENDVYVAPQFIVHRTRSSARFCI